MKQHDQPTESQGIQGIATMKYLEKKMDQSELVTKENGNMTKEREEVSNMPGKNPNIDQPWRTPMKSQNSRNVVVMVGISSDRDSVTDLGGLPLDYDQAQLAAAALRAYLRLGQKKIEILRFQSLRQDYPGMFVQLYPREVRRKILGLPRPCPWSKAQLRQLTSTEQCALVLEWIIRHTPEKFGADVLREEIEEAVHDPGMPRNPSKILHSLKSLTADGLVRMSRVGAHVRYQADLDAIRKMITAGPQNTKDGGMR